MSEERHLSDEHDHEGLYVHGPQRQRRSDCGPAPSQAKHDALAARLDEARDTAARVEQARRRIRRIGKLLRGKSAPARPDRREAAEPVPWRPRFVPPGPVPYTSEQRDAARVAFAEARRAGRVQPPTACECCDRPVPLHGHHTEYADPLRVLWLCGECHRMAHGHARPVHLIDAPVGLTG